MDNSCGSLERDTESAMPWNVVARRAKNRYDMRPVKTVPRFSKQCCARGSSCQHQLDMCSIDREVRGGSIGAVEQFRGGWERVPVTVDSGAIDSVIPRRIAQGYPVSRQMLPG